MKFSHEAGFSRASISWLATPAIASRGFGRIHSRFLAHNLPPLALVLFVFPATGFALGQEKCVETAQHPDAFTITQKESLATIYVNANDDAGAVRDQGLLDRFV
jgi:hypothetical protein